MVAPELIFESGYLLNGIRLVFRKLFEGMENHMHYFSINMMVGVASLREAYVIWL